MNQITIFANGDIPSNNISIPPNSIIIAADGGARHCFEIGIIPNIVVGDCDSLTDIDISRLETQGVELIRYSVNKDETDLELALIHALIFGPAKITLYGLLGRRWDMTFANIFLLAEPRFASLKFQIFHGDTSAYILRGSETLNIKDQKGASFSAIPLTESASGITYHGLRWPLENALLSFGTPRGVSNTIISSYASIKLEQGIILVFVIDHHENT